MQRLDGAIPRRNTSRMNRELIRKQLVGAAPMIIRTSDGKEYRAPHPEFVLVGRHNVVIEDERGLLDILDPLHIVSIQPGGRRRASKASTS